jgi:hypothetical protein
VLFIPFVGQQDWHTVVLCEKVTVNEPSVDVHEGINLVQKVNLSHPLCGIMAKITCTRAGCGTEFAFVAI